MHMQRHAAELDKTNSTRTTCSLRIVAFKDPSGAFKTVKLKQVSRLHVENKTFSSADL